MYVYELARAGRMSTGTIGIFSTVEKAKEAAALVLESYREYQGDPDTEQTNYDAEWVERRAEIPGLGEVGDPMPFLEYGSCGSSFKIVTVTVDAGRTGMEYFTV